MLFAVALNVNEVVVSPETSAAVPVIWPVVLFNEKPAPPKLLVVSEYVIVSPSESVADGVTFTLAPSKTDAIFPAAVDQVGDVSTLMIGDDIPNKPDGAVNFTLYDSFE